MLEYLRHLIELLLSPSKGWEDLAASRADVAAMTRRGFYPLLVISALTEFCGLFYNKGLGVEVVFIRALIDFGAYFVSLYAARMLFGFYESRAAAGDETATEPAEVNRHVELLILMALGEMLLIQIAGNIVQAEVTVFKFLPIYVVLILCKALKFMDVPAAKAGAFIVLSSVATVVVPLVIYYLLSLILL